MLFIYCKTYCPARTDKGVIMPKHVFLFSGSSAVGKTSILRYLIPLLENGGMKTAICKIDCLSSNDETVYKNLKIPGDRTQPRYLPGPLSHLKPPGTLGLVRQSRAGLSPHRDCRALPPMLPGNGALHRRMCLRLHRQQPLAGAPWSHGLRC